MFLKNQILQITHSKNFKHGVLYTFFSFVNSGISFILLLILARYLTPYGYGQLNLFTTFVTLLNILITLSTTSYISVSFFKRDSETLRQIILIALGVTTIMLVIISIIFTSFPLLIERSLGVPIYYLWLGLLICYFQVFNSLNLDIWRLEENPVSYGIYSMSFAVCNFILTFYLVVDLNLGWDGRVYAWGLLGLLYFIISIVFLVRRRYLILMIPKIELIKETLLYSLPLLPHTTSFWIKQGLDRYIINFYYDQSFVGYYSFAMNIASIIGLVGTAFNATNSVFIFKKLTEGYEKVKYVLKKQTRIMICLFFIVSVVVGIFGYLLISWKLIKYSESLHYIIPLCVGGFFQCVYLLWVNFLFFFKKTKQLMYITFSVGLLQCLFSIWLTRYSVLWTAIISMISSFFVTVCVYFLSNKIIRSQNIERGGVLLK